MHKHFANLREGINVRVQALPEAGEILTPPAVSSDPASGA
jgi:hypothetical protein